MTRSILAIIVGFVLLLGAPVNAQKYPDKVITIIVPFTAGGPTDTVARLIAQPMTKVLKQQVIVENVGGAGGTIAAARVARATPDGYTLFCITSAIPRRRASIANSPTIRSPTSSRSA